MNANANETIMLSVLESRDCREIFRHFPDFNEWVYEHRFLKSRYATYEAAQITLIQGAEIDFEVTAGYLNHIRGSSETSLPAVVPPETGSLLKGSACVLLKPAIFLFAGHYRTDDNDERYTLHLVGPKDILIEQLARAVRLCYNALAERGERPFGSLQDLNLCLRHFNRDVFPVPGDSLPGQKMVDIRGGHYLMGSNTYDWEGPPFDVIVRDFSLASVPVTTGEYRAFQEETGYHPGGNDLDSIPDKNKQPVVSVSWFDAVEYCNWLSRCEGLEPCYTIENMEKNSSNSSPKEDLKRKIHCDFSANGYRLPTEAEWEYAASGGRWSNYTLYAGFPDMEEAGWSERDKLEHPESVARKRPNELGLYDMSGNVFEWCWDWYNYYPRGNQDYFTGTRFNGTRIFRGGSYKRDILHCRITDRGSGPPDLKALDVGFRVARSLTK